MTHVTEIARNPRGGPSFSVPLKAGSASCDAEGRSAESRYAAIPALLTHVAYVRHAESLYIQQTLSTGNYTHVTQCARL